MHEPAPPHNAALAEHEHSGGRPIPTTSGQACGTGIWENRKEPASGEWIRTFVVITTDANEMVAAIHDRMPAILVPGDHVRG